MLLVAARAVLKPPATIGSANVSVATAPMFKTNLRNETSYGMNRGSIDQLGFPLYLVRLRGPALSYRVLRC